MATPSIIYLDNNATTRVDPEVVAAMAPFWSDTYFNPSSVVGEGSGSAEAIRQARKTLAKHLGGDPSEYVLTSGATESNNWVIKSITSRCLRVKGKCHIVTSAIEHPSVLDTLKVLQEWHPELKVNFVPVTSIGEINLEALRDFITEETDLVSIMFANNESGVIQPIAHAGQITKSNSNGHAPFTPMPPKPLAEFLWTSTTILATPTSFPCPHTSSTDPKELEHFTFGREPAWTPSSTGDPNNFSNEQARKTRPSRPDSKQPSDSQAKPGRRDPKKLLIFGTHSKTSFPDSFPKSQFWDRLEHACPIPPSCYFPTWREKCSSISFLDLVSPHRQVQHVQTAAINPRML